MNKEIVDLYGKASSPSLKLIWKMEL